MDQNLVIPSTWKALQSDTLRQAGHYSLLSCLRLVATQRTFRPVATLRLCHAVHSSTSFVRLFLPVCRVLHRFACGRACIDLPWRTSIGAGFSIAHGWGLVVNQDAVIGRNVTLFHGVTLGRRDRLSAENKRTVSHPVIEDEVWIGPHALIIGGVRIGRGSRIAGGAYVTDDVPPYSIVSGNPAVIVKRGCVPDVMNPSPL
ncbi:MAG: serine acetyltransferase [Herminiimonas sp.]|nr:serine acetyltransferase [Herminiimonas sp.]MDB5852732.1 serine acetyltransferase [Herminiimonas sp.]